METVHAKCSAVSADSWVPQKTLSTDRIRRTRPRSESTAMYDRLVATHHRYTHGFPEDAFPTFLETQLFDQLVGDVL